MSFPKLILHFDVNQTLINKDKARGFSKTEVAANQMAKETIGRWTHHPLWKNSYEPMCWRDFVEKVVVPGDRVTDEMAEKRKQLISDFPTVVGSYPALKDQALSRYHQYLESSTDSVFDSFFHLIEKMKERSIRFVIVLRTFGYDLKETVEAIEKRSSLKFGYWGEFKAGCLHLRDRTEINFTVTEEENGSDFENFSESGMAHTSEEKFSIDESIFPSRTVKVNSVRSLKGKETKTLIKTAEIFRAFAESTTHFAVRDSYKEWNSHQRHFSHGKQFIYDEGKETLSLFFDDNLKGQPDQDIVCPKTTQGVVVTPNKLMGKKLFKVHTGQAMIDPEYFVSLVNQVLSHKL